MGQEYERYSLTKLSRLNCYMSFSQFTPSSVVELRRVIDERYRSKTMTNGSTWRRNRGGLRQFENANRLRPGPPERYAPRFHCDF